MNTWGRHTHTHVHTQTHTLQIYNNINTLKICKLLQTQIDVCICMARHINACMPIYTHSLSTWQQINTYTLCNSVMYGIMPICKQKQTFVALKLVLIIEFSPDLLFFSTLIYFSLIPHPLFFHPIDSFRIIELWQPAALYVL